MKGDGDNDSGSYRAAISPDLMDDGRTPDGKPRALRFKKATNASSNKKSTLDDLKQECQVDEHKLSIEQLCSNLQTDPELGLTPEQARDILLRDGPNALTPPKKTSEWVKFSKNLFGGFAMLLWIGAILCFVAYAIQSTSFDEVPDDNVSCNFRVFIPDLHSIKDDLTHSGEEYVNKYTLTIYNYISYHLRVFFNSSSHSVMV